MVYQRKKRTHESYIPQQVPQEQTSLLALPEIETEEAENLYSATTAIEAPSWETLQRRASQPRFGFGRISIAPTEFAVQRQPVNPSTLSKQARFRQRVFTVQREPMGSSMPPPRSKVPRLFIQREPEVPSMSLHQTRPMNRVYQTMVASYQPHAAEPPNPLLQRRPLSTQLPLQRDVSARERRGEGSMPQTADSTGEKSVDLKPKGSGRPLPKQVTDNFVQSGYPEVKQARVHVDDAATQSIEAKAYTQQNNIVVQSSGANDPQLLGHEATHVVQQSQMALKPDVNGTPINANPALEKNADDNGERVARNQLVRVEGINQSSITVQASPSSAQLKATETQGKQVSTSSGGIIQRKPRVYREVDSESSEIKDIEQLVVALHDYNIRLEGDSRKSAEAWLKNDTVNGKFSLEDVVNKARQQWNAPFIIRRNNKAKKRNVDGTLKEADVALLKKMLSKREVNIDEEDHERILSSVGPLGAEEEQKFHKLYNETGKKSPRNTGKKSPRNTGKKSPRNNDLAPVEALLKQARIMNNPIDLALLDEELSDDDDELFSDSFDNEDMDLEALESGWLKAGLLERADNNQGSKNSHLVTENIQEDTSAKSLPIPKFKDESDNQEPEEVNQIAASSSDKIDENQGVKNNNLIEEDVEEEIATIEEIDNDEDDDETIVPEENLKELEKKWDFLDSLKDKEKANYTEKQRKKVEKLRENSGDKFRKKIKSKMVNVVKTVQKNEGGIQQADNYIHGDAAINTYFHDMYMHQTDKREDVEAYASEVFKGKFKEQIMPDGKLDINKLANYATSSRKTAKESAKRVKETQSDRIIVELFYNQVEKLTKEKGSVEEVGDIYQFAKDRQWDVYKRREKQKEERKNLEKADRISTTVNRAAEATKYAVANTAIKILTLGLGSVRKNRDKRGWVAKEDFSLDLETETASHEWLNENAKTKRKFDFRSPIAEVKDVFAEFKAKWKERNKGIGLNKLSTFFSTLALGLEAGKKLLGLVKGIFASLAILATGISLIPGAQFFAVIAAFCSSITYWLGATQTAMSVLIAMFNSLLQICNTNPALFAELAGETGKSWLNVGTEGASATISAFGTSALREHITDTDYYNKEALYNPEETFSHKQYLNNAPSLDTDVKLKNMGAQGAGILVSDIATATVNAGGTAGKDALDNNDMKYSVSVNPNRRIGKPGKGALNEPYRQEQKFIRKSLATTLQKANKKGKDISDLLSKIDRKPPEKEIDSDIKIPEDDTENMDKLIEIGGINREFTMRFNEGLRELSDMNKKGNKNKNDDKKQKQKQENDEETNNRRETYAGFNIEEYGDY
ncbi:MAG: DUF4157 domain-containing protein [Leptolyngbya sp. SIO1D8]|nr:DUF4157 domain-containing protein [Leptolyngbya sp. SIO1D8]